MELLYNLKIHALISIKFGITYEIIHCMLSLAESVILIKITKMFCFAI